MTSPNGPALNGPAPIVAVIGAGVTGSRLAEELRSDRPVLAGLGGPLRVGIVDRRPDVAASVAHAVSGIAISFELALAADVAVLAHATPHAPMARRLIDAGVSVVSLGDDVDDIGELVRLGSVAKHRGVSLVVGAAMAPGLSGLLARQLAMQLHAVDEVHVAVHGTGGPECARQHHRTLAGTSLGLHDGAWIERPAGAGRELCWFPEPVNAYDCYRAALPDPLLLHRVFPGVTRMSVRRSATRRDRFTARLPMLSPPHAEGGVGAVRVDVRGALAGGARETLVAGVAVRRGLAAAIVGATMTRWVLQRSGSFDDRDALIVLGDERLPTADLLDDISAAGVPLFEFTGVSRPPDP